MILRHQVLSPIVTQPQHDVENLSNDKKENNLSFFYNASAVFMISSQRKSNPKLDILAPKTATLGII